MEPTKKEFLRWYDKPYPEEELIRLEGVSDFLDCIDMDSMMEPGEDILDLIDRIEDVYPYPDNSSYQLSYKISADEFETYLQCRYGNNVTYLDCTTRISCLRG